MYEWLKITTPADYRRLIALIGHEFGPARVVPKLQSDISPAVKGVLVEFGYIDKDYRSTYYNFYSKKGRRYGQSCIRLHFFDDAVSFDSKRLDLATTGTALEESYFGFIVLRPTLVGTIGRSVLSPNIRIGAKGAIIQSRHHVHLLGHKLHFWGFPSMDQHTDISVCAHVACWSILRHYSERYPQHRELLMHDVTLMAHQFNPGGLVPSNGLDINEAERVFHQANTYPLIVTKTKSNQDSFYRQMIAYLESCFPLFVAMYGRAHAIALVGHAWQNSATPPGKSPTTAWHQVESLSAVDDNYLPYLAVPRSKNNSGKYSATDFDSFIVPLPEKIFYPADAVDRQSIALAKALSSHMSLPKNGDLIVRYFVTTLASLRTFVRRNESSLGDVLTNAVMQLSAAQFVWIVEYSSTQQWNAGHVSARAVIDATASPQDINPVWFAHDGSTAVFFDRDTVPSTALAVPLNRPNGPLGRMEQNLRPVVYRN